MSAVYLPIKVIVCPPVDIQKTLPQYKIDVKSYKRQCVTCGREIWVTPEADAEWQQNKARPFVCWHCVVPTSLPNLAAA
jgi:hypothetical protein